MRASLLVLLVLVLAAAPTTTSYAGANHVELNTVESTYGFIPCSTTWAGNVFLMLVYGYFMYTAATYLYVGCELLLEIVGGLFIPLLSALPHSLLILVSGLFGSNESAQSQVSVGMGLVAGSCVIVGKCDLGARLTCN